ncbi:unnamed protein product [Coregonus sp. 'balchen']|nr:unnamed protein product [Coregonus sp. 'balchen']
MIVLRSDGCDVTTVSRGQSSDGGARSSLIKTGDDNGDNDYDNDDNDYDNDDGDESTIPNLPLLDRQSLEDEMTIMNERMQKYDKELEVLRGENRRNMMISVALLAVSALFYYAFIHY